MHVTFDAWIADGRADWEVWIGSRCVVGIYDSHYTVWRRGEKEPIKQGLSSTDVRPLVAGYDLITSWNEEGESYWTSW